jgi:hypothetical protein
MGKRRRKLAREHGTKKTDEKDARERKKPSLFFFFSFSFFFSLFPPCAADALTKEPGDLAAESNAYGHKGEQGAKGEQRVAHAVHAQVDIIFHRANLCRQKLGLTTPKEKEKGKKKEKKRRKEEEEKEEDK